LLLNTDATAIAATQELIATAQAIAIRTITRAMMCY